MLAALTTLGVLAVGVVPGILVGVAISLLALISRISNPPDAVLREVPGGGFHDVGDAGQGQTVPGLIVYRFYAPLLFSNCGHFVERVRGFIAASPSPVRWFVLDAQAMTDVDVTAAEALRGLERTRATGHRHEVCARQPPVAQRPRADWVHRRAWAGELLQFGARVRDGLSSPARHAARAPLLHRQSPTQTIVGDDVRSL